MPPKAKEPPVVMDLAAVEEKLNERMLKLEQETQGNLKTINEKIDSLTTMLQTLLQQCTAPSASNGNVPGNRATDCDTPISL